MWKEENKAFMRQLSADILSHELRSRKRDLKPTVRLNGTSDIEWEYGKHCDWDTGLTLMEAHPTVQFYDYTKNFNRMCSWRAGQKHGKTYLFPANYHLTFSRSEENDAECRTVLKYGGNIAVVGTRDAIKSKFPNGRLVDGDKHDLRFLDPPGSLVVLEPKGKAKTDQSDFVIL